MLRIIELSFIERIVRKGKNAGYQHFSPFPTMFSTSSLIRFLKKRESVLNGLQGRYIHVTLIKNTSEKHRRR